MGFNFPNAPTVNQVYNPGGGLPVYRWDGEKWVSGMAGVQALYVGDTAPVGAAPGSLWWNSANGQLYIYYADPNSNQWVVVVSAPSAVKLLKNYVVNGAMMVSQENSSTAGTVAGYYPTDQFKYISNTTGVLSVAQVASVTPSGSPNRLRATVTTADAAMTTNKYVFIQQGIEGLRVADLRMGTAAAKQITVSFGCKGPAGTYCIGLGNAAANRTYVGEFTIAAAEANTDVLKSVTLTLDAAGTWAVDSTAGIYLWLTLMAGPTYQTPAGVWTAGSFLASPNQFNFMGTVGNVFELFDVGLYEGAIAPPFQVPDYASELALCKRYFETVLVASYGLTAFIPTQSIARVGLYYSPKRATPTFLVTAANVNVNCTAGNVAGVSTSTNAISLTFVQFDVTVAGTPLTVGQAASIGCGSPFLINARL
jgi:hypothetical protein